MKNMKPDLDLTKTLKKRKLYKITAFSCIGLASCGIIVAIPVTIITLSNNATTNTPIVPIPNLSFSTNIDNVSLPSTSGDSTILSVSVSINNHINVQNISYQWFSSDTNNSTSTWTKIINATNSSYEVTNITSTKKYFKCEVYYPNTQPLTSNIIYVEKLGPPPPPPIVEIPSSVPTPDNGGEEIKTNENEAIVNEWYRHIATRSASINFVNNKEFPHIATAKGTAWILDYELPTNGTYPLKWYYSTNAHVANNLKNPNDYDPYKYSDPEGKNTIKVFFELATYYIPDNSPPNPDLTTLSLPIRVNLSNDFIKEELNTIPKTIFTGVDYLKSHPSKWNPKWVNEEIIDVAILEITFNDEAQARKVTYNYANLPEEKKIKFATSSLMTNYNTNILSNEFYVAGFPDINGKPKFMENTIKQYPWGSDPYNIVNQGSPLAKFPYASTFQNKPGVIDNIIGLTLINVTYHGVEHKLSGIAYSFRHSSLPGGSSGSMALNKNYEVLGNHFAGWNNSDVGLTISYLSEGGTSHLNPRFYSEPYNLIFGGYENQKNSYKQAMQKIYGPKPNTHLFSRMTK